jgi:2-polyprenyl-3-methyl-5-hydroxy-6-metoxy-1,4-benzoquinol methylase
MLQGFLVFSAILLLGSCFLHQDRHQSLRKGDFSFKTMAAIHDNSLRRILDNPFKTLKAAGLKPGDQVLEIGCGPGFFTIPAGQLVGDAGCVHAIDINPQAVKVTGKKAKEAGLTNVQVRIADAAKTGLPDASIDAVLLFSVLPHLPQNTVLPELARVLKEDGIVAVRGIKAMSVTDGGLFAFIGRERGVYLFRKNQ